VLDQVSQHLAGPEADGVRNATKLSIHLRQQLNALGAGRRRGRRPRRRSNRRRLPVRPELGKERFGRRVRCRSRARSGLCRGGRNGSRRGRVGHNGDKLILRRARPPSRRVQNEVGAF
jgi:hypothetical protein